MALLTVSIVLLLFVPTAFPRRQGGHASRKAG